MSRHSDALDMGCPTAHCPKNTNAAKARIYFFACTTDGFFTPRYLAATAESLVTISICNSVLAGISACVLTVKVHFIGARCWLVSTELAVTTGQLIPTQVSVAMTVPLGLDGVGGL